MNTTTWVRIYEPWSNQPYSLYKNCCSLNSLKRSGCCIHIAWFNIQTPCIFPKGFIYTMIYDTENKQRLFSPYNMKWLSILLPNLSVHIEVKVKVKFTLEQATKDRRGSRCIALLLLKTSALEGGVWSTPCHGHFIPRKDPVPIG
jgi:hypothetical protein